MLHFQNLKFIQRVKWIKFFVAPQHQRAVDIRADECLFRGAVFDDVSCLVEYGQPPICEVVVDPSHLVGVSGCPIGAVEFYPLVPGFKFDKALGHFPFLLSFGLEDL